MRVFGPFSHASKQYIAGIGNFGGHDSPSDVRRPFLSFRESIMSPAQQHITPCWALNPRKHAPMLGEEGKTDMALGAQFHQERAARNPPEADDIPQSVYGDSQFCVTFDANFNGFSLAQKI
jgi:hypothetical protein